MQFLEKIALSYIQLGANLQLLVAFCWVAVGVAIFALTNTTNKRLSGMSYLAILALIVIALESRKFLWLGSHFSIAEGMLWVPLLVQSILQVGVGFVLAYIGVARSLDVIGHRRWALFSFIPIVNIGFGFVPSKKSDVPATKSYFDGLVGPYGIAVLVVLVISIFSQRAMLQKAVTAETAEVTSAPSAQVAMIQSIIATRGLDFAIASLVSGSQSALPARIDDITVLNTLTADANTMTSVYIIEQENWAAPADFVSVVKSSNCEAPPFAVLLDAGAIITEVYARADGTVLTEISTRREDC